MSLDLLKEFGSPEVSPWRAIASESPAKEAIVDEDDFGDFEDPENEDNVSHLTGNPAPPSHNTKHPVALDLTKVQPSSRTHEYSQVHPPTTKFQNAPSSDDRCENISKESVMFDADIETMREKREAKCTLMDQERLQEAGDLLLHPTSIRKRSVPASLVPIRTGVSSSKRLQEDSRARHESSGDVSRGRIAAATASNHEQPTIDDEPWVDFDAAQAAQPAPNRSNTLSSRSSMPTDVSNIGPPPSNIPPPSILFPIIANVLGSLPVRLKTVTSAQPLDQPSNSSEIRALLSTIRAAARILAGRKLRWKRDVLLSQSMKIGPAHSGKLGGMKLVGVDKAESRREDQEAAETLQVWKQQVGPLRSTVATLNSQMSANERFNLPEIADNMPIRQGKPSEGVVTAPKCCFLCGIRRDERIAKVDVDVEDSFGEFWVEHWGHVDCVDFWKNHKDFLQHR
ncbi:hypothetical protein BDR22DRAFT_140773 [Usnea florida]